MSLNRTNPEVVRALNLLSEVGLRTGTEASANTDAVDNHRDPRTLRQVLEALSQFMLLSGEHAQANFDAIVKHENLSIIAWALKEIPELLSGDQAQANFDAVVRHKNTKSITHALGTLSQANLLDEQAQANRDAIFSKENPEELAWGLARLSSKGLLRGEQAQANHQVVIAHQDPWNIASALVILSEANLLTGAQAKINRQALAEHPYPSALLRALDGLSKAGLLLDAQPRFNALNQYATILFGSPDARSVWNFISVQQPLNQTHFDAILDICNRNAGTLEQGRTEFVAYVNREILGIRPEEQARRAMNDEQSTHTASVHTATDLTAWLLSKKYAADQDVPDAFAALSISLAALKKNKLEDPTTGADEKEWLRRRVDAATRCLTRLKRASVLIELPVDKKQACLAMADDEQKQLLGETEIESLKDSSITLTQFIHWLYQETKDQKAHLDAWRDSLYEIQRGYNLNEKGEEINQEAKDSPICFGGTTNKFCERLIGLSPLIVFRFIDKAMTTPAKLNSFFIRRLMAYCESLLNEGKFAALNELLNELKGDAPKSTDVKGAFTVFYDGIKDKLFEDLRTDETTECDEASIKTALNNFEEHYLPYYTAIDHRSPHLYSKNVLKKFTEICEAAAQSTPKWPPYPASVSGIFSGATTADVTTPSKTSEQQKP